MNTGKFSSKSLAYNQSRPRKINERAEKESVEKMKARIKVK
jgi:hypothetical protein